MNCTENEVMALWYLYDDGATIGKVGSCSGIIVRDSEFNAKARLTAESGSALSPYSVTCHVYGVLLHTVKYQNNAVADAAYDRMKVDVERYVISDAKDDEKWRMEFASKYQSI
ncbi:MAG: hypothetical protein LBU32_15750 [Clostridiales bacterium]|jgi:hypothetical protein|nr:hypothetical protein [Clostridiales bacterium]